MDDYTDEERALIGTAVEAARLDRQWGKEQAARHARISSITWKRVEDGLRVQSTKLRAIEIAFGWAFGSIDRLARGRPIAALDPDPIEAIQARGWGVGRNDAVLWSGFQAATQFARDCEVRGAPSRLASDFVGDAVALLNAVSVEAAHPGLNSEDLAARRGTSKGQALRKQQDEAGEGSQDPGDDWGPA